MGAELAVVGHVFARSWRVERRALFATWAGVALLMTPLMGMSIFSYLMRRVWESTPRGTYVWTKADSVARGQTILGPACELTLDPEGALFLRRSTWVIPASIWPSMGWRIHWLSQAVSPAALLIEPPPRGAFRPRRIVGGELRSVAGLVLAPRANLGFRAQDAFLLARDSLEVVSICGPMLGVVRRVDALVAGSLSPTSSRMKEIATPGSIAYSQWLVIRRVLVGVVVGTILAMFAVTAGAAHFWAAGEAPAWAVARLVGCPWSLLRWQVALESAWLLAPGILTATAVTYAMFDQYMRWQGLGPAPFTAFVTVAALVLLVLWVTLASLLFGRIRRLNPMDGLREAREWLG